MALCVSVQSALDGFSGGFSAHRVMAAPEPEAAYAFLDPPPASPSLPAREDQVRQVFPETFLFSIQTLE